MPDNAQILLQAGYTVNPSTPIQPHAGGSADDRRRPDQLHSRWRLGYRFKCIGGPNNSNDQYGTAIPNCDAGAQMYQEIFFPQCWDGRNLDRPTTRAT